MPLMSPEDAYRRRKALAFQRAAEGQSARAQALIRRSLKKHRPLSPEAIEDARHSQEMAKVFAAYAQSYVRLMEPPKNWWNRRR